MKKGFTLIELLAVIVILAIIALIATPIILGIINDAREESNERSVELYASAVRNAVAAYQLTGTSAPTSFDDLDIQYDGDVVCTTQELYEDGSFYIADCAVNGTEVDYTYGEKQELPSTRYYSWSSGNVGGELPDDAKPTVAELNLGIPFYLGLDIDSNNKVTETYVCFVRNKVEYCIKGYEPEAFATNTEIIKEAYVDLVDTNDCSFSDSYSGCYTGDLNTSLRLDGSVYVDDGHAQCDVSSDGGFRCWMY